MDYRLFIAIDPPDEIRSALHDLCTGLEKVRWMPLDQIHLTIRFIGPGDGALIDDMCHNLSIYEFEPFELRVRGTGHFPPRGEPKVIWAGLEPSESLKRLYNGVNNSLVPCGIEREGRKFSPHITLGRLKHERPGAVGQWLSRTASYRSQPFKVDSFHLYTSRLNPQGAIHEKLASF